MSALPTTRPDRAGWLERRRQGIGASDAAAIVGLHPWVSALGLYYEKRGEVAEQEQTEAMEWGLLLEGPVADQWQRRHPNLGLRRFELYSPAAFRVHPEHEWMVASLDGEVYDDTPGYGAAEPFAVYEGKTANGWAADQWDDTVPPYVAVQVQHQLAVTGLARGYVACLVGGSRFVEDVIDRDDEFIANLIVAEERFWQRIQSGDPPAADSHPDTARALKERWQDSVDNAVDLGDEGRRLVTERLYAKAELATAKARCEAAENGLRSLLGENEVGLIEGEIAATWRPDKNGTRRLNVRGID